ncbi:MAG: NifB/NifX family molybdenum-iron cluster-binding protein [Thermoguttaceae bacterium]
MKVAVTAQDRTLDSLVDPRFGRARYFLLIDTETGNFTVHDNLQNLNAPQGAGIQAAQTVVQLGAEAVLTGNVGPKAFAALQAGQVAIYPGAAGTVRQTLEEFRAGRLPLAGKANVEGHWA